VRAKLDQSVCATALYREREMKAFLRGGTCGQTRNSWRLRGRELEATLSWRLGAAMRVCVVQAVILSVKRRIT